MNDQTGQKEKLCPICGSGERRTIYRDDIPLHTHTLFRNTDDPRLSKSARIEIVTCDSCVHGYHAAGDEHLLAEEFYETGDYKVSYFGAVNNARIPWILGLIGGLAKENHVERILEIACGAGEVLQPLSETGYRCVGVDLNPAVKEIDTNRNLEIFCTDFHQFEPEGKFDLVLSRLFLEHMEDPVAVLRRFADFVREDGIVVTEVPNATEALSSARFYEYYHEHRQYYSVRSISLAMKKAGLAVESIEFNREKTVMIVVARNSREKAEQAELPEAERATNVEMPSLLVDLVGRLESSERPLWWGAGFTGVRILNALPENLRGKIRVVDGDPLKKGALLPGTSHEVLAPPSELDGDADFLFIASVSSAPEIAAEARRRGYEGEAMHLTAEGSNLFAIC